MWVSFFDIIISKIYGQHCTPMRMNIALIPATKDTLL